MTPQHINDDGQTAWIAEHADLPYEIVEAVLELELDYMVAVGIADASNYEVRYYSLDELPGAPKEGRPRSPRSGRAALARHTSGDRDQGVQCGVRLPQDGRVGAGNSIRPVIGCYWISDGRRTGEMS